MDGPLFYVIHYFLLPKVNILLVIVVHKITNVFSLMHQDVSFLALTAHQMC